MPVFNFKSVLNSLVARGVWKCVILIGTGVLIVGCDRDNERTLPGTDRAERSGNADLQPSQPHLETTPVSEDVSTANSEISTLSEDKQLEMRSQNVDVQMPASEILQAAGLKEFQEGGLTLISDLPVSDCNMLLEISRQLDLTWNTEFRETDSLQTPIQNDWFAFVIDSPIRFEHVGLMPGEKIGLLHGLQLGNRVWLRQQESEYYLRHLFVHEAIHRRMMEQSDSQSSGTLWWHEGSAELWATHDFDSTTGETRFGVVPAVRDRFPGWAHYERIERLSHEGNLPSIRELIGYRDQDFGDRRGGYALAWAMCQFLKSHPFTQVAYQQMYRLDDWSRIPVHVERLLNERPELELEWRLCLSRLNWESVARGHLFEPIERLETPSMIPTATGRYYFANVDAHGEVDVSVVVQGQIHVRFEGHDVAISPTGITARYIDGFPAGALIATVYQQGQSGDNPFLSRFAIGDSKTIQLPAGSQLVFGVNDRGLEFQPEPGSYSVKVVSTSK